MKQNLTGRISADFDRGLAMVEQATKPPEVPGRKPSREPALIAIEKAYRSSNQFQLDRLLRKRSLYKRRLTLALSGLEETESEIRELLGELARPKMAEPATRIIKWVG